MAGKSPKEQDKSSPHYLSLFLNTPPAEGHARPRPPPHLPCPGPRPDWPWAGQPRAAGHPG
eukprot:9476664-Pyramimonas_sp.AAC.1